MGVHTGDSITVAPAQTLTDRCYQEMRDAAIRVIRAIGVDPANRVQLSGSYAVNEGTREITVSIAITGLGTVPLAATYAFDGNDKVTLTIAPATATLLGPLFGTTFEGSVTLTLLRD